MKPVAYLSADKKTLSFDEEYDSIYLYSQFDVEDIIRAIRKCFPSTMACDGALMVNMDNYNELVELINK